MSPGSPTNVRTVPVMASTARANRKVLLGRVAQADRAKAAVDEISDVRAGFRALILNT